LADSIFEIEEDGTFGGNAKSEHISDKTRQLRQLPTHLSSGQYPQRSVPPVPILSRAVAVCPQPAGHTLICCQPGAKSKGDQTTYFHCCMTGAAIAFLCFACGGVTLHGRSVLDLRRKLRKSRMIDAIHMEGWFDSLPFEAEGWLFAETKAR
jgi:hypothetical protein